MLSVVTLRATTQAQNTTQSILSDGRDFSAVEPPPSNPRTRSQQSTPEAPFVVRSAVWYRNGSKSEQQSPGPLSIYARPGGSATLVLSNEQSLDLWRLTLADFPGTSTRLFIDLDPVTLKAVPQRFVYKNVEFQASTCTGSEETTTLKDLYIRRMRNGFRKEKYSWVGEANESNGLRFDSIAGTLQVMRSTKVDVFEGHSGSGELRGHLVGYVPKKNGPNLGVQTKLTVSFCAAYLGVLEPAVRANVNRLEMLLRAREVSDRPLLSTEQLALYKHYLPHLPQYLFLTHELTQSSTLDDQHRRPYLSETLLLTCGPTQSLTPDEQQLRLEQWCSAQNVSA